MASNTSRLVELSMIPPLAKEVTTQISGATSGKAGVVALTPLTVTATSGSLPTPGGTVTIANTATPTVVELLDFCVEINAKFDALVAALKA